MRIGIDIRELERDKLTGIGRYTLNFLGYVTRYDRENEYILFGNQKTACPISGTNIRFKIIPEFNKLYWDQIVLAGQINKENLDMFFSPYYKCPVFSSVKVVVTCHDLYPFSMSTKGITGYLARRYHRFMLLHADMIITVSEYVKREMLNYLNLDPSKIKVVYNSVGEEFKTLDKKECLSKVKEPYGITRDFILYVGNLKPHKNLERLIQAYSLLNSDLKSRFQLVIAAKKDELFAQLYKFVSENKLENDIVFTDNIRDKELVCLYNAATVYVSISLHEGFGLPFVEAMASGVPVVASNTSAIPEVVGDAAMLVNPYDTYSVLSALEKVLEDKILREGLIAKGLLRAKDFSIKAQAEKTLEIFKELAR